jgi:hypothetical protein
MIECDIRDTVSSIGITGRRSTLPGTIDGMTHVCYFRHALALDERRVKFLPEYAYGGSAKPVKLIHKTRGMWGVIQLVICVDPGWYRVQGTASSHKGGLVCRDALRYVSIFSLTSQSLMYGF